MTVRTVGDLRTWLQDQPTDRLVMTYHTCGDYQNPIRVHEVKARPRTDHPTFWQRRWFQRRRWHQRYHGDTSHAAVAVVIIG